MEQEATNVQELAGEFSREPGGQRRWVLHAWQVLTDAGLVPHDVDPEHPNYVDHLATLAALAYLAALVVNDRIDVEPPAITEGMCGVTDIALGRYAERRGIVATEFPESAYELGQECVEARLNPVVAALAAEVGVHTLFAELWAQRSSESTFPLAPDDLDDILNSGLTADKMAAYEWLSSRVRD